MNREKILEKSRRENLLSDERETKNKIISLGYSSSFGALAFIVLFILSKIYNIDITAAKVMMYAMLTGELFYNFISKKSETDKTINALKIFVLVASAFLTIAGIVDMIK